MKTIINADTARAWVGCLGCYNAGRLNGKWVDGITAGDLVGNGLARVETVGEYTAARCLICFSDEFWVMDLEGYGDFLTGECAPFAAQWAAELMQELESEGIDLDAAAAFINDRGAWDKDSFEDSYVGQYDSLEEYAQELAGELYGDQIENAQWPFTCINWEQAAFELSFDYAILGDGYVFRQN